MALNSIVLDPLITSILIGYGFDLWSESELKDESLRGRLKLIPHAPRKRIDRLLWIFNYVRQGLTWEVLFPTRPKQQNDLAAWFDQRYPALAHDGRELLARARQFALKTPQQQRQFLSELVRVCGLEGEIVF